MASRSSNSAPPPGPADDARQHARAADVARANDDTKRDAKARACFAGRKRHGRYVRACRYGGTRQPGGDQRRRNRKLADRQDVLVWPPLGLASRLASLQSVAVLVGRRIVAIPNRASHRRVRFPARRGRTHQRASYWLTCRARLAGGNGHGNCCHQAAGAVPWMAVTSGEPPMAA
jgi:hypothetical protein